MAKEIKGYCAVCDKPIKKRHYVVHLWGELQCWDCLTRWEAYRLQFAPTTDEKIRVRKAVVLLQTFYDLPLQKQDEVRSELHDKWKLPKRKESDKDRHEPTSVQARLFRGEGYKVR